MSRAAAEQKDGVDGHKGRVEVTKVKRYRPGQVPEWMKQEDAETEIPAVKTSTRRSPSPDLGVSTRRPGVAAPVIVKRADDSRLSRLAANDVNETKERSIAAPQIIRASHARRTSDSPQPSASEEEEEEEELILEEARQMPRRRYAESSDDEKQQDNDEEDDEDAIARRRAAMRERMRQQEERENNTNTTSIEDDTRQRKQGIPPPSSSPQATAAPTLIHVDALQKQQQEKKEDASESEYSTDDEEEDSSDDDDDEFGFQPLVKPIFVPKSNRQTLAEREALEREEEIALEKERKRKEERKAETKEIVAARMAEEAAQEAEVAAGPRGLEDIDTDDERADEVEEYESWKLREMKRIARDKEEREKEAREAEEREKWKAMSEEERKEYLEREGRLGTSNKKEKKSQYTFLQRYYHKGAFFQTEAEYKGEAAPLVGEVLNRDFSAPTGEDKFDRSALPSVMQVRNFGKRSRSKWTHLKNEDTTDFNAPWATDKGLKRKMEERASQEFTKPKNMKT